MFTNPIKIRTKCNLLCCHLHYFTFISGLTLFFPMFSFGPPENIRKPKVFRFQGDQEGTLGKKKLIFFSF